MSSDAEYDEVVVNLKVIASITVNSKLYTKGSLLNIEQASIIPEGIRRWYRQDNRDEAIKKIDRVACLSLSLSLPLSRPPFSPFVPLPLQTVRLGQQRRRVFLCLGVMSGDAGAAVFWRVGVERDEKEKNARSSPPPLLFCSRKKKNTEQASSASAIPLCGQEGRSPTLSSEQTRSPLGTPR